MDNKKVAIALIILGALVIILLYGFVLKNDMKEAIPADKNKNVTVPYLSDFQTTACNAADRGGTCRTKLPKLNLITPEECCRYLGKCCERG